MWVWIAVTLATLASFGCRNAPEPVEPVSLPESAETAVPSNGFSGASALDLADELAAVAAGADGAVRLRERLGAELLALGAEPLAFGAKPPGEPAGAAALSPSAAATDVGTGAAGPRPLVGVLPGRSPDLFLLVAGAGAALVSEDDPRARRRAFSGAAVLLELARILATEPRAFTIWLVLLPDERPWAPSPPARVRLAVCLDALADPALRIARDLRSNRPYRETFFESAGSLGLDQVFASDAPLRSPAACHETLLDEQVPNVVALVGARELAATDSVAPRAPLDAAAEHAATALRLDEFGAVVLDALGVLAARLARIDAFARDPLAAPAD